jgi:hypothetical protein
VPRRGAPPGCASRPAVAQEDTSSRSTVRRCNLISSCPCFILRCCCLVLSVDVTRSGLGSRFGARSTLAALVAHSGRWKVDTDGRRRGRRRG